MNLIAGLLFVAVVALIFLNHNLLRAIKAINQLGWAVVEVHNEINRAKVQQSTYGEDYQPISWDEV